MMELWNLFSFDRKVFYGWFMVELVIGFVNVGKDRRVPKHEEVEWELHDSLQVPYQRATVRR
jgi:hypothetical protein